MSSNSNKMTFKGHNYIRVEGDAGTPARFWKIALYTEKEFNALSDKLKEGVRSLLESDQYLIDLNF